MHYTEVLRNINCANKITIYNPNSNKWNSISDFKHQDLTKRNDKKTKYYQHTMLGFEETKSWRNSRVPSHLQLTSRHVPPSSLTIHPPSTAILSSSSSLFFRDSGSYFEAPLRLIFLHLVFEFITGFLPLLIGRCMMN